MECELRFLLHRLWTKKGESLKIKSYLKKFPPGQPSFFYVLHNSMLSIGIDLKSVVIQHAFKQLNYQGFSRQLCYINQSFFIQKLIQLVLYRFSHNRFDALGILIVSSTNYLWFCGIIRSNYCKIIIVFDDSDHCFY